MCVKALGGSAKPRTASREAASDSVMRSSSVGTRVTASRSGL